MIDSVRLTFAALREGGHPSGEELSTRRLPVQAVEALLAIDASGRPHLLLPSGETDVRPSGSAAIEVSRRVLEIGGGGTSYLDAACEMPSLEEVFDHFVVAVIDRIGRAGEPPSHVVAETVERWRSLLVAGRGAPGRDRLASLFGELLVVADVARADPGGRVDAWVGPVGGRHDLRRGSKAIEVKTTRTHTSRVVTIHGEDQLLEPSAGTLHVHLVRLEEVPGGGRSVPVLVDELLAAGVSAREAYDAVAAAGLPPADFPAADDVRFDVRERMTIPVDDTFPRIVPSSFVGGARPTGVVDVSYRIDVDHSIAHALDADAYVGLIRSLATGHTG